MIAVTAGKEYIDIDAFASMVAYRDLLKLLGRDAIAVSTARMNGSIPRNAQELASLDYDFLGATGVEGDQIFAKLDERLSQELQFIVLDLSNPDYFDPITRMGKIIEVVDHHPGSEDKWQDSSVNVQIEMVGAVATLIFEKYVAMDMINKMSSEIAKLLMMAILDNTLNFRAKITIERDREAFARLSEIAQVNGGELAEKYFLDCQKEMDADFAEVIKNDTKTGRITDKLPNVFGQLVLWNGNVVETKINEICDVMDSFGEEWIMNVVSLSDGRSYIIASNKKVLEQVEDLFGVFSNDGRMVVLPDVWLRKEIMKKALED